MRSVKMYHGNETLEDTVRIFRGAKGANIHAMDVL